MKIENILKNGYKLKDIIKENDFYILEFVKNGFVNCYIEVREVLR